MQRWFLWAPVAFGGGCAIYFGLASEPGAHYVLVSTRDPDEHELRSYRIVDGVVTEEPVTIVEQY